MRHLSQWIKLNYRCIIQWHDTYMKRDILWYLEENISSSIHLNRTCLAGWKYIVWIWHLCSWGTTLTDWCIIKTHTQVQILNSSSLSKKSIRPVSWLQYIYITLYQKQPLLPLNENTWQSLNRNSSLSGVKRTKILWLTFYCNNGF